MSLVSLRKLIVVLNQVMKYAIRHRYIDFNPVRDIERPRDNGEIEKPKIRVLDSTEINALLDATESQKFKTLFMLALISGARQGELFGLLGPDGAGKTTTLRMLAEVMKPSSGDAEIQGVSVVREPETVKHHIAYMSQRFGLYQDLTVIENIDFYADLYLVPPAKKQGGSNVSSLSQAWVPSGTGWQVCSPVA